MVYPCKDCTEKNNCKKNKCKKLKEYKKFRGENIRKNKIYLISDKNGKVRYNKNIYLSFDSGYKIYNRDVLSNQIVHKCKEVYYGIIQKSACQCSRMGRIQR